jgi:hypothetical protein
VSIRVDGGVTRLEIVAPREGSATMLREWADSNVTAEPSPEGRQLLVQVFGQGPRDRVPRQSLVYDLERGDWLELLAWPHERQWAGPQVLARIGPGRLAFEPLDPNAEVREIIGRDR